MVSTYTEYFYTTPYPPEFKCETISLVCSSGRSVRGIARDLGICYESLRLRIEQVEIDAEYREDLASEERKELVELRRMVHRLEREPDILSKATASFAREGETRGAPSG